MMSHDDDDEYEHTDNDDKVKGMLAVVITIMVKLTVVTVVNVVIAAMTIVTMTIVAMTIVITILRG